MESTTIKPQLRRLMLCGGGTAGSVGPLLAVAGQLRQQHPGLECLFVGTTKGQERTLAEAAGISFHAIPAGKLRRYWSWYNLTDLIQLWRGFWAARRLIKAWQPQVIISAGSFVAVPLVWAGKLSGCKILIHQQDVRPGLANQLMARAADRITVSLERSLRDFPRSKAIYTGNPVRPEVLSGQVSQAQKLFHLQPNVPTILVLGGSSGSSFLNHLVGAVGYRLVKHWEIIHLTGAQRDFVELEDDRYHRYDFLTWQLPHALAVADIVVSRAGLGMITELAALGKSTMVIPMPGTHQEENARLLQELQAAVVLDQNSISPNSFFDLFEDWRRHPEKYRHLAVNFHRLYRPDAAAAICREIEQLVQS